MNRALTVATNDLRLFLRNKGSYIWLLLVPLVFTVFLGFANRGPGSPSNPRPPVLVENLDTGILSVALLKELDAQGMRVLAPSNRNEAQRGIRIPADFTLEVLAGRQGKITFFQTEGSSPESGALIEARSFGALVNLNSHLIELAARTQAVSAEALAELQRHPAPVQLNATFAGRRQIPSGFSQSLPGVLGMTLMMNLLIFGGATLAEERRSGLLRRLATCRLQRWELIAGKIGGLILLGTVQCAFFLLLGEFAFHLDIGSNVVGIAVTALLYIWVAASIGVLIGSVILREDKIVAVCVLSSMVMAALGGCWWPLEVTPDRMQQIGHLFPTAWAMDAFHQLISFGSTDVLKPWAALTLFGLAANAAAARWFRVT